MTRVHTRLTVNLNKTAAESLHKASEITGLSRTDCVNRALIVYAFVEEALLNNTQLLVRHPDGTTELVRLLG